MYFHILMKDHYINLLVKMLHIMTQYIHLARYRKNKIEGKEQFVNIFTKNI